jgi:UDP-2,3-diacylglucosamine pyrophosphatase LpxH
MLVVISDLHLNDDSAAPENIHPGAFAIWMKDVIALARHNKAKELVFVYLGDMVDLLRTEYWFYPAPGVALGAQGREDFPLQHRPWGTREINRHPDQLPEACRARALEILQKICSEASEHLAYLRGDAQGIREELAALGIPIRRLYLPGNHDRLFWVDPAVRRGILAALGATVVPGQRPWELALPEYGVLARHGHEWDPWNFEAFTKDLTPADLAADDYKLVPIGDPIVTELLARLPYEVCRALPPQLSHQVRTRIYEQLRYVEDVQPLHQALHWVLIEPTRFTAGYDAATRDAILDTLGTVAKQVFARFMGIPFVNGWLKAHDKWNLKLDEADKLQDIHRLLRVLDIRNVSRALELAEKLGLTTGEDDAVPAAQELGDFPRARYCIYGHSHWFRHVPFGCNANGDALVYFNSGTWRPRLAQTRDRSSFVAFKEMTYLVFYRADEDPSSRGSKGLSYELWNGIMHK